ncbi:MAG: hypothetical protein ACLUPK_08755 [Veillonella sp.]
MVDAAQLESLKETEACFICRVAAAVKSEVWGPSFIIEQIETCKKVLLYFLV